MPQGPGGDIVHFELLSSQIYDYQIYIFFEIYV